MGELSWKRGHSEFRAWLDVPSGWEYDPLPTCLREEFAATGVSMKARQATLEANFAFAGGPRYGLLGLRFESNTNGGLHVEVHEGEKRPPSAPSIAWRSETVSVGLSNEFSGTVFRAICETVGSIEIRPAGRLVVSAAGEGMYGSCDAIMYALAERAVQLVFQPDLTESQVREMVEAPLSWRQPSP